MESGKWKTHPTENVSTETWRVNRSFKTSKHFALCERLSSIYSNAAASRIWNSFLSRWFIRVLQQSVIYQKKKKFEPLKTTSMWWRQIMILTFRVMLLCSWVQYFFKNGPFRPLFSFFLIFSTVISLHVYYRISPMARFKPRTFGIGSNHSTNWVTTTAQYFGQREIKLKFMIHCLWALWLGENFGTANQNATNEHRVDGLKAWGTSLLQN